MAPRRGAAAATARRLTRADDRTRDARVGGPQRDADPERRVDVRLGEPEAHVVDPRLGGEPQFVHAHLARVEREAATVRLQRGPHPGPVQDGVGRPDAPGREREPDDLGDARVAGSRPDSGFDVDADGPGRARGDHDRPGAVGDAHREDLAGPLHARAAVRTVADGAPGRDQDLGGVPPGHLSGQHAQQDPPEDEALGDRRRDGPPIALPLDVRQQRQEPLGIDALLVEREPAQVHPREVLFHRCHRPLPLRAAAGQRGRADADSPRS
ncbi:hypothetical protein [Rathayibacter toxicus]|uniref:hypothetical protein n=1 Tax=Rathayibacter toxicus TaxID=145458 RepID=UPI0005B24CCC|nr:hypothetical protein [Rathayibacter toxicus]AJM77937.1 hypothetical protein TI83_08205 [Rathayibacter toxicus]